MSRKIIAEQKLNDTGKIGVLLLLISPVIWAICYYWLLNELTGRDYIQTGNAAAATLISLFCFVLGGILLLIGRDMVIAFPDQKAND